jgi:hypothetical protein
MQTVGRCPTPRKLFSKKFDQKLTIIKVFEVVPDMLAYIWVQIDKRSRRPQNNLFL